MPTRSATGSASLSSGETAPKFSCRRHQAWSSHGSTCRRFPSGERRPLPMGSPRGSRFSGGNSNVSMGSGSPLDEAKEVATHIRDAGISSFVIDSEQSFITFGLAHTLSDELGAKYLR